VGETDLAGGNCNIADESNAFIFDKGTIFVDSHHDDCATEADPLGDQRQR
jgi:hypothetical protein